MTIGEKIQHHRKNAGLSQEELGQRLLVSRQTISLWEHTQTIPTRDNLIRLKEIFGISVDEI
ncbi:MAG: helix-turn-helix transcriptional regulator, partial [Clostridia bacterium]|nr:helix-turn-helix transcriptional regulator [Clostridia bacterium]